MTEWSQFSILSKTFASIVVARQSVQDKRGEQETKAIEKHLFETMASSQHLHQAGNHGDVLKHVILRSHIVAQQMAHEEGILLVDTHCGPGLYDLGDQKSEEYKKGILRISQNIDDAPLPVKHYFQIVKGADSYMQQYPGSPVFGERLMRLQDEHRLCDLNVGDVKGLKKKPILEKGDAFHPEAIEFFLPASDKHPVLFVDPSYEDDEDFYRSSKMIERVLERNPYTTIILWYPMIENHRYRYNFAKNLKEMVKKKAKVGFYHAWVTVQKSGLQGSSVFIVNPTKKFDDIMDEEVLDWLSAILLKVGRSEYSVEQWMKKPKKKPIGEGAENAPPPEQPVRRAAPPPVVKKPAKEESSGGGIQFAF